MNSTHLIAKVGHTNGDYIHQAISRHRPDVATALSHVRIRSKILRKGNNVCHKDDEPHLYVVVSGCLKQTIIDAKGDDHVTGFYFEGDIIGPRGPLGENHCIITTGYDTTCLAAVPLKEVFTVAATNEQSVLFKGLNEELTRAQTLTFYLTNKHATSQLAWFLLDTMKRRGGVWNLDRQTEVLLSMPRCDIASYLGLAQETVSRELSKLAKAGVIEIHHRLIRILDLPGLEQIADVVSTEQTSPTILH